MSRRSLKLIAPFRCQFNVESGMDRGEELNTFLESLNSDLRDARERLFPDIPQGVTVEAILRPQEHESDARFISLDKVSHFFNSPKYLSILFGETLREEIEKFSRDAAKNADERCGRILSDKLSLIATSADIAIYDNTIAILTLDVSIGDEFGGGDWAMLDEWTTNLVLFFLGRLYKSFVYPTLRSVNRYALTHSERRVSSSQDYVVYFDVSDKAPNPTYTRLLWTNRTLICPKGEASGEWTSRSMDATRPIEAPGIRAYLGVGNNVIETNHGNHAQILSPIWQGMHLAQYYYAVMYVMGKNLKRFIGAAYDKKTIRELRALSRTMDSVINAVTIFQVEYQDLPTELQGLPRTVFHHLEREWDFKTLAENVQGKMELCKSHLQLMNAYINHRNSIRVEIVLTGLAGVGFIGLMTNLSAYGRALMREGYNSDVAGLLDLGQRLSPNLMIWIGIVLAVAVIIFVSANRTR